MAALPPGLFLNPCPLFGILFKMELGGLTTTSVLMLKSLTESSKSTALAESGG